MGPGDFHHVSLTRAYTLDWDSETGSNATPRLPQNRGHSGHTMLHLSCLNDNVILSVPDTKPQKVVLGSSETKLSILVSTMRDEGCCEKLIKDTRSAFRAADFAFAHGNMEDLLELC